MILITNNAARFSRAPPHRFSHDTAETLSPRNSTLSRGSTIGEGGDTTISSPGRSLKQPLLGIGLNDPLHGGQACPEFIAFDKGVGQICPR